MCLNNGEFRAWISIFFPFDLIWFVCTGISTTSLLLELFSYTVMTLYNYTYQYSLLSYLEYPILIVQEYILLALVFNYKRMYNQNNLTCIGAYFVVVLLFAYQICPRFLLSMAVVSCFAFIYCFCFCHRWILNPIRTFFLSHFVRQSEQQAKYFNFWKFYDQKIQQPLVLRHGFYQLSPI